MNVANREQAECWNSGEDADHWITNQSRYDAMLAPFTDLLLDTISLQPAERVLDVGCGCGATTLEAARVAVRGGAVGIDLSVPMLARARTEAVDAGLSNAEFLEGDAQVYPFVPGSFDAVISRFGVMFFEDPVAAFTNILGALGPGGRLAFVCWQPLAENQWLTVPGAALADHVELPELGKPNTPGMFGFADPERIGQILASAGLRDVRVEPVRTEIQVGGGGTLDDAVEFLRTGSIGRTVLAGIDPETQSRALAAVRAALAPYVRTSGVELGAATWLVQAAI